MAAMLEVFTEELARSLPFREDATQLRDLLPEVPPVLEVLLSSYRQSALTQAAMHEAFALFTLLCRRAGQLGATPVTSLSVLHATLAALELSGILLREDERDQLAMVAVEGYTAGRDEQREQGLRSEWARTQVWIELAPRCFCLFLAGSHPVEQLEPLLDRVARELFRAEARSVVIDLARWEDQASETARLVAGFASTLLSLGARLFIHGAAPSLRAWIDKLGLDQAGAELCRDFESARSQALAAAGFELRPRRRLADLLGRKRANTR